MLSWEQEQHMEAPLQTSDSEGVTNGGSGYCSNTRTETCINVRQENWLEKNTGFLTIC